MRTSSAIDFSELNEKCNDLFLNGQEAFNEQNFIQARNEWEKLASLEMEPNKSFVEALMIVAGHFAFLQQENFIQARELVDYAHVALQKLIPTTTTRYIGLDLEPILHALSFNLSIFDHAGSNIESLRNKEFIFPKLLQLS